MNTKPETHVSNKVFPVTRRVLGDAVWNKITSLESPTDPLSLQKVIGENSIEVPDFLNDLIELEWLKHQVAGLELKLPPQIEDVLTNPTLDILPITWDVTRLLNNSNATPLKSEQYILVWQDAETNQARIQKASNDDLLALKIIEEDISLEEAAESGGASVAQLKNVIRRSIQKGILIGPASKLVRDISIFNQKIKIEKKYLQTDTFTLQWHITNDCDLHCKHCYDRAKRSPLTLEEGHKILNDLDEFSKNRHVRGHVCFSGGNPFMSPHFFDLYGKAAKRGFSTSILGNPVSREELEKLVSIQTPGYFQVSLEGLEEHNDDIRGKGFYARVFNFLKLLREFNIESAIMLTLTKDNMNEILPLTEKLKGKADYFTFNRLSQVGEGANLMLPNPKDYSKFLKEYADQSEKNSIIGFKDNLLNIVLKSDGDSLFGGCTGYGCGAAFNFAAVLPDGEVHACRKFPSPIGNILSDSLESIYDSKQAQSYRRGPKECDGCEIRHVCGGCLAVADSYQKNISEEKDPFCFWDPKSQKA